MIEINGKKDLQTKSYCRFDSKGQRGTSNADTRCRQPDNQSRPRPSPRVQGVKSDLSARQYFKSAIRNETGENVRGKYKRKLGFGHYIIDFNVDIWSLGAFLTVCLAPTP